MMSITYCDGNLRVKHMRGGLGQLLTVPEEKEWKVNLTSWIVYFSLVIEGKLTLWPLKAFLQRIWAEPRFATALTLQTTLPHFQATQEYSPLSHDLGTRLPTTQLLFAYSCVHHSMPSATRLDCLHINWTMNYNITQELPWTVSTKRFTTDKQ